MGELNALALKSGIAYYKVSEVKLLSCVQLFGTPWTVA